MIPPLESWSSVRSACAMSQSRHYCQEPYQEETSKAPCDADPGTGCQGQEQDQKRKSDC